MSFTLIAFFRYRFGIVMAFAGLLGVPLGSTLAQVIRHKVPNADPLVCGTTLLMSVPVMYAGFIVARFNTEWCYGLTFLAGIATFSQTVL